MKTAIIDADSLLYIVTHCKKKYNSKNEPIVDDLGNHVIEIKELDDCIKQLDTLIYGILAKTGSTHYIMYLTIGKSFRYDIYPDYKGNRKSERPKFFEEVRNYLIDKYKADHHPKLEADDCCLITKNQLENSFICAIDKDVLNLEGKHFNYNKFEWVETTNLQEKTRFWIDMITGQSGDNIKGDNRYALTH